jgi:crotonobetainyl-CoA:carnitine CoA-transferase CaiB-like acyl-CoA transferase
MAAAPRHVLDGVKALDFTQFVAGPTVTKLMAEMGAEVIKVEVAPDGDRCRTVSFMKNNRSGYFVQQNRGKLSLCLDVRQPAAKEILRGLIPKVDVIVENFAWVIKRMGFDYETVKAISKNHHVLDLDFWGLDPLERSGYISSARRMPGVTSASEADAAVPADARAGRRLDRRARVSPRSPPLFYRDRTGGRIDISLLDACFHYDWGVQTGQRTARSAAHGQHYSSLCPRYFKGKGTYIFILRGSITIRLSFAKSWDVELGKSATSSATARLRSPGHHHCDEMAGADAE